MLIALLWLLFQLTKSHNSLIVKASTVTTAARSMAGILLEISWVLLAFLQIQAPVRLLPLMQRNSKSTMNACSSFKNRPRKLRSKKQFAPFSEMTLPKPY